MLFTEQGRGLTEEKASRPALPHVWMWTGVTQQDMAQTEAPGDGSPLLGGSWTWGGGHLPTPPRCLCRAGKQRSPPVRGSLPRAVLGSLPRTPMATCPGSAEFCRREETRPPERGPGDTSGHREAAFPRGQDERSIALKRSSNLPFPLIRLLTAQSKYFYKSGISLPICISDIW